jgi:sugar phosphate isomerase/epimerase
MKLSISTLVCPNWSWPQIVGAASAHGINGIDPRGLGPEIDVTKLSTFGPELEASMALLHEHGLEMPCLNTSIALVTAAPERWEMMLAECQRYARLAERSGAKFLRVFGGSVPKGMSRGEGVVMARRHLKQLAKMCLPHRCTVLVETHDEWAIGADAMELLDGFSSKEVGVLWDIEHPVRKGEEPHVTAEMLKRFIRHVHFKDSIAEDGKNIPRLLGAGDLPLPDAIRAMQAINYDGWICLETEKRWHPQAAPEPEESVPQFKRWMDQHWNGTRS